MAALEDDQFVRAREDSSAYPHYELIVTRDDVIDDEPVNNATNFDEDNDDSDDDGIGDFPWLYEKSKKINDEEKEQEKEVNVGYNIEANPLYTYNYWERYQSLTLNWPNCDGKCGNKLGKLIHDKLYGKANNDECKSSGNASDLTVLYIDNYALSSEDFNALQHFSMLNPVSITTDQVIQMWSFVDSLKTRVQQHMSQQTQIAHENKVQEIINKDIESTLKVKDIISEHFLCYSTPIRRYLISLLHSFDDSTSKSPYRSLLKILKHKQNIICDDQQTLDIWSRLTSFKDRQKYFILYQLSRYSCYNDNMTLFQELKRNGFHTISPNLYTNDMVRIIKTKQYATMRKYNLELTAEEIISILIYTGPDEISKSVRESLIMERRSCKWMQLTGNLVSAVEKMHKILVQTKYNTDLPQQLYYAIGGAYIKTAQIIYFDVISTTSNKNLAVKFMKKGTMIIFDNTNDMLQTSRFIAAPLNWITSRNKNSGFSEWLVTCIKIHDVGIEKRKSDDGNYTITCRDYETVNFRSMGTWRKVIDAAMILDQPNPALQAAANAAILNSESWKCIHCQCEAPFYCYSGNILMDNMECLFCRRYNLFSFNIPTRIVSCFNPDCKQESMLQEYIIDTVNKQKGAICPKCNTLQAMVFEESMQFKKMLQYLCVEDGYKEKLRQEKIRKEQAKKLKEERRLNVNNCGGIQATQEKGNKKKSAVGGFFAWGQKKKKVVKSSNLNDIEENPAIIEDDFD